MAPIAKRKWWMLVGAATLAVVMICAALTSVQQMPAMPRVLTETFYEFADGQQVCNRVFFFEIDGFLTADQCDQLRNAAISNNMHDSKVGEEHSSLDYNVRRSTQTWFRHGDNAIVRDIKDKVTKLITNQSLGQCFAGVSPDTDFEDVQVVRYTTHGKYDPHFDATECGDDVGIKCVSHQRIATVLMYLNDDFTGGETRFPNLNIAVKPKKGKAIFFWVSDKMSRLIYNETLHGGDPVTSGEKWIATQWIRAPVK